MKMSVQHSIIFDQQITISLSACPTTVLYNINVIKLSQILVNRCQIGVCILIIQLEMDFFFIQQKFYEKYLKLTLAIPFCQPK